MKWTTVRYRKRRRVIQQPKISYKKKEGNRYEGYLKLTEDNLGQRIVQMGTVEGEGGGKLLQIFLWLENNLMLAYRLKARK